MRIDLRLPVVAALGALASACVCSTRAAAPPNTTVPEPAEVYWTDDAPAPVADYGYDAIWYYGPHPVGAGYGRPWCDIMGPHSHPYEPGWEWTFAFWDGYYFFEGDPTSYGYAHVYAYGGPHPNPWGGWCYHEGPHRHYYAPRRHPGLHFRAGVWIYDGPYDDDYRRDRDDYDHDGHRRWYGENGHHETATAYHEHVTYRGTHGSPAGSNTHVYGHDTAPGHDEGNHTGHEPAAGTGSHEPASHDATHGDSHEPAHVDAHGDAHHVEPAHVEPLKDDKKDDKDAGKKDKKKKPK